jgi:hypothetical protein
VSTRNSMYQLDRVDGDSELLRSLRVGSRVASAGPHGERSLLAATSTKARCAGKRTARILRVTLAARRCDAFRTRMSASTHDVSEPRDLEMPQGLSAQPNPFDLLFHSIPSFKKSQPASTYSTDSTGVRRSAIRQAPMSPAQPQRLAIRPSSAYASSSTRAPDGQRSTTRRGDGECALDGPGCFDGEIGITAHSIVRTR